ncbi:MAG TPA: hypothetical protein VHZ96_15420 [Frankiaceae bacterium]|nr:hypothetical protein [Frankiaceae bacterium]
MTGLDPIADSPERAELRAIVRRAIADVSPPERITELDEAETFDEGLHQKLARAAFATVGGEGLHAAAACIGAGRGAFELAVSYAKERVIFGRPDQRVSGPAALAGRRSSGARSGAEPALASDGDRSRRR